MRSGQGGGRFGSIVFGGRRFSRLMTVVAFTFAKRSPVHLCTPGLSRDSNSAHRPSDMKPRNVRSPIGFGQCLHTSARQCSYQSLFASLEELQNLACIRRKPHTSHLPPRLLVSLAIKPEQKLKLPLPSPHSPHSTLSHYALLPRPQTPTPLPLPFPNLRVQHKITTSTPSISSAPYSYTATFPHPPS